VEEKKGGEGVKEKEIKRSSLYFLPQLRQKPHFKGKERKRKEREVLIPVETFPTFFSLVAHEKKKGGEGKRGKKRGGGGGKGRGAYPFHRHVLSLIAFS